jgi:hypothetical protein
MGVLADLGVAAEIGNVPAPIPLPAAGWLLLAGLGAVAALARRGADRRPRALPRSAGRATPLEPAAG